MDSLVIWYTFGSDKLHEEEKTVLGVPEKTIVKKSDCYDYFYFEKNEETKLPYNGDLIKTSENNFNKNTETVTKLKESINSCTESAYIRKLSREKGNTTSKTTNYIPHQSMVNHNKLGILRVIYYTVPEHFFKSRFN